jgi:hypothetical protein
MLAPRSVFLVVALAACAQVEDAPAPSPALGPRYAAYASGAAIRSSLRLAITTAGAPPRALELHIGQASARLGVGTERARLDALALDLGELDAAFGAARLRLAAHALRLPGPTDLEVAGPTPRVGRGVLAVGEAALALSWALAAAGQAAQPLGPVPTAPAALELVIVEAPAGPTLVIDARCWAPCLELPGLFSVGDASLHLELPAQIVDAPVEVR